MTLTIDRRALVRGGALGLGALLVPGGAAAVAQVLAARGFTHGVASGEPGAQSMLLWSRFVGAGASARVEAQIAETPDFRRVVAGGMVETGPWRDWTVKVGVRGLAPGRRYFYRFVADGQVSAVGRTKTLPAGRIPGFALAVFSCANLPFGHFNAYAHAAARDDLDLAVHLGDYLYEYPRGTYPSLREQVAARTIEPAGELIDLADYRLRYACYRADPDLQALHAALPMIVSQDDHESANDSWEGGAENHTPAREGDWGRRRAAALQAWHEWMPVAETPWAAYDIGDLATLFRTDSRLVARSRPPSLAPVLAAGGDTVAALTAFRDGAWQDAARSMLGSEQEAWLADALARSVGAGRKWQVVGVGTIMGEIRTPPEVAGWLPADAPDYVKARVASGLAAAKVGLPFNLDSWGGYPAARQRLLAAAQAADADLVVLAGDSHNGWAFELANEGRPAGVEFDGHSVSSPGFEGSFRGIDPKDTARALVAANPALKWVDTSRRGYLTVRLAEAHATAEWAFLGTVEARDTRLAGTTRWRTRAGARRLEPA
jgi:alkaline phosphatase D